MRGIARHRPELDGIRALAVLAVFGSHVGLPVLHGGWIGVSIFFVLSGYLITTILLAEWARREAIALRRFYLRRLLRLSPALILLLVACLPFALVMSEDGTFAGYLLAAAATALYLQDFALGVTGSTIGEFRHTWSLAVEEQFYLIWPPVVILLLRRGRSVLGWALAGTALSWVILALTTQAAPPDSVPATYAFPHTRAGELLLGCALAAWLARDPDALRSALVRRRLAPVALAGLALIAVSAGEAGASPWMPVQIMAVAVCSAALILGLVADDVSGVARMLRWRPLVLLGMVSYGFYLFHLPVLDLVTRYVPVPWAVATVLSLAISLGLSALSYRYLEMPFLRLKERLPEPDSRPADRLRPT